MYAYTYIYTSRAHMHAFMKIVINWQIYRHTHIYKHMFTLLKHIHTHIYVDKHNLDALQTYAYIY